jgi:IS30 family transposase
LGDVWAAREIGCRLGAARSTIQDNLKRAASGGARQGNQSASATHGNFTNIDIGAGRRSRLSRAM